MKQSLPVFPEVLDEMARSRAVTEAPFHNPEAMETRGRLPLWSHHSVNDLPGRGCKAAPVCSSNLPPVEASPTRGAGSDGWKAGKPVSAFPQVRAMGGDQHLSVGSEDDYEGLSTAVHRHATFFYSCDTLA